MVGVLVLFSKGLPANDLIEGDVLSNFAPAKGWFTASTTSAVPGETELSAEPHDGPGGILINATTKKKKHSHLRTKEEYGDVSVHLDFMIPEGSNSGVYLMGRYEIQVFDSYGVGNPQHSDLGGLYQRWDGRKQGRDRGYDGVAPLVNAAKPAGEWQTLEIVFRAPRFDSDGSKTENARFVSVHLNDQLVQEEVEATGPTRSHQIEGESATGPIVIQGDHGPIAIRSLKVESLDLQEVSSVGSEWIDLFNGENLEGWTAYRGKKGDGSSLPLDDIFRVIDGAIRVYADAPEYSRQFSANLLHDGLFSEFHLQVEYRWLGKKFIPRSKADRDAGILFHIYEEQSLVWPSSVEMQLGDGIPEENGKYVTGDLFVLGRNTRTKTPIHDGVFQEGAELEERGRFSPGKNLRGVTPIYAENPIGEWNLAEVVVHGSEKAEFYLNGTLVNQVFDMEFLDADEQWKPLGSGQISVQAEWADLEYRVIRLKDLGE